MTSRERLLAAMRREDVDHVPCSIYFNANLTVPGYDLNDWRERIRLQLDLGTDPVVGVGLEPVPSPGVSARTWVEPPAAGGDPVLFKEYRTSAGTLRMGVRKTSDWPPGMDIPWGDHSAGHIVEPLIKSPADVGAFEYLWQPPGEADLDRARAANEAALLIYYRVVTGMEPLLSDIASAGFDCIEGGEPRLSRCSLEMWRDAFAGKAASWTGVSSPVLLGGNDPEAVRREVRQCLDVFGGRGFILGVTNSIRNHFPWPNTLAMIDEWKKTAGSCPS